MTLPLVLTAPDRILLLAPHPDDETLAAGGLLQRATAAGAEVRVLFVTDGENNPWAQRATERRWRIRDADRERWGERRRNEALAALGVLGITPWQVAFLGFPDQGLERLLVSGDEDLVQTLTGEIERFRPTFLTSPALDDLHPDHSALAVMIRLALERMSPAVEPPREGQFVVHDHGPYAAGAEGFHLVLNAEERERKRRAILCHASQLRLRRGALLGFAGSEERFEAAAAPAEAHPAHVVRQARVRGDALHLDLARRGRPGACGPTDLLLTIAGEGGAGVRRTLRARLPRRSGALELFDPAVGARVARGEFRRGDGDDLDLETGCGERVALPAALLAGARQAFVKLERRLGFFDEAGWRALPCGSRHPAAPARAARAGAGLEVPTPVARGGSAG